jgi:hypothetical protein
VRREKLFLVTVAQVFFLMSPYVLPYVSYFDLRCRVRLGRVGSSEDNEARFVGDEWRLNREERSTLEASIR